MLYRVFLLALLLLPCAGRASELPRILASADNPVPKCVAPASLMKFVQARNAHFRPARTIDPRFDHIASVYQRVGNCVSRAPDKCVAVRWDYAFFQMLLETNYLTFRRPNGAPASVTPQDNNFAGVGAAISGRPGEKFKDVQTGVLAHLQHVLMYSLTPVPNPVAQRTRQVQADVQYALHKLHHPVTFDDLAQIWTGSNHSAYGAQIQQIAERYAGEYCGSEQFAARASRR
jgi:hypothetical protein